MKKYFILLTTTVVILLASCSKFEDGPCISFRSEFTRLEGDWLLKYFTVDGVDSLSYWNNYFGNECKFIFQSGIGAHPLYINWITSDSQYYKVIGNFSGFVDNLLVAIEFSEDIKSNAFPLWFMKYPKPRGLSVDWTIDRLKYKEVWFQMDVNNKHYELQLERINN